jgi:bleomycin hydrolase
MSNSKDYAIDVQLIQNKLKNQPKHSVAEVMKNAIIANGIEKVAFNNTSRIGLQNNFSHEIKSGKVTSQEKSGRCWMFAGLNLFRSNVTKKLNTDDFEFSQNYPMFFDKLEKANYFLESIIKTVHENIYSRIIMWLLTDPLQDGGQWDMFANLINKYGAVPKNLMPETYHSSNSAVMNQLLTFQLRKWASVLRDMHAKGCSEDELRSKKLEFITEFYRLLSYFLGEPPAEFHFEYRDKEENYHSIDSLTPCRFYSEFVGIDLNNYISLINAPTPDKPYEKTYTIDYLGNVIEGQRIRYLNTPLEEFKSCTVKQLKDGEPVWFGCDVRLQTERQKGLMDTRVFLFDNALDVSFDLDKSARLLYGESLLTHAMVFTGVNLKNNKPDRWKVENSWGEERGEKGFFVMSDKWFDEYNYQVVIHKKHLSDTMIDQLNSEPVLLPPWDPIGSLAKTGYLFK